MSKLTKTEFDKVIADLGCVQAEVEADGMEMDDSIAFEIARSFAENTPGLQEYVVNVIGATDYVGYLANQI